jgi:hypothetical protein
MTNVTSVIMRALEIKFNRHLYSDDLYASYAHRLACGYAHILHDTLFEEFLGEVVAASTRDTLDALLERPYLCQETDFGPNHEAVARLLESGRCCACFTTNFDNAIEQACKSIGLNLYVWDVIVTRVTGLTLAQKHKGAEGIKGRFDKRRWRRRCE